MKNLIQKFKSLPRIRRQSILFGWLLGLGIFFALIAVMAAIKITPMETYLDPQYKLRIKYPAYWQVIERPKGGALVAFVSPKENEMDWFQDNVNITAIDVASRRPNIREFANITVRQLAGVYEDNIKIMESRPYSVGGYPGYLVVFAGQKTDTPIKYMIVLFIKDTTAYIIAYGALESDFGKYAPDVLAMFRSVRFS